MAFFKFKCAVKSLICLIVITIAGVSIVGALDRLVHQEFTRLSVRR